MRTRAIITILLLAGSLNLLIANNVLPEETRPANSIINVHLNLQIIGTAKIEAKVFYYDIVGLAADATAKYLTSGATKDRNTLVTDLKLNKDFVKIGIKLRWDEESKYFLMDREKLVNGKIDLREGKE